MAEAGIGHNLAIKAPELDAIKADLEARFPNVTTRAAELEKSAASVPAKIDDEDTCGKAAALVKMIRTARAQWDSTRKIENEPWRSAAAEVNGFFTKPIETLKKLQETIEARITVFLEAKKERERLEREEAAKRQRDEADRLLREAEEAEARRLQALKDEAAAKAREEQARRDEEAARERQRLAEEAAAKARAETERLTREKRERDEVTRAARIEDLKTLAFAVAAVEGLNDKDAKGTASADERAKLDDLLHTDGTIATLWRRVVADQELLTETMRGKIVELRTRTTAVRDAIAERRHHEREERDRVARETREAEDRAAAARRAEREADEQRVAETRAERMRQEAAAETAKEQARAASKDARGARADQREAVADQKDAAKDERLSTAAAERTEARADRMERRLDESSDADLARTRGEHGTTGTLVSRWEVVEVDQDVVDLEALRHFLHPDAVNAAVYRFMIEAARQGVPALKGAVFAKPTAARVV